MCDYRFGLELRYNKLWIFVGKILYLARNKESIQEVESESSMKNPV